MSNKTVSFSQFGKSFQEELAFLILDDREFSDRMLEVLNVEYLEFKYLQVFIDKIFSYKKKYTAHPSYETLKIILKSDISDHNDVLQKQIRDYYARSLSNMDILANAEYVKDKALDFCRKQKLREAMIKSTSLLKNSSFDEISQVINDALKAGAESNQGYDFLADFEKRYEVINRDTITTGWDKIDDIINGGAGRKELGVVIAPTGCHAKGTPIMLHDGRIIPVEKVEQGDILMGPGGSGRLVECLIRGNEVMYEISPTKGDKFTVNENHILSLKRTNDGTSLAGSIVNISVKDYLKKSDTFKHIHKIYRTSVKEFSGPNKEMADDPYFIGLMLGDGSMTKNGISFTTADKVLAEEVKKQADRYGMSIRENDKKNNRAKMYSFTNFGNYNNLLRDNLEHWGIFGKKSRNKFVPHEYKTSSFQNRLEILAGLIDTDGSLNNGCYDYISKSKNLSDDVAFIARSVGLAAYVKKCEKSCQRGFTGTYWRVTISGDISIIPCRLERKKANKRKQIKDVLVTGFKLEKVEKDDYYGFQVSGDNLYLMGDFTVTHNCGKSMVLVHLGAQALKAGMNVVHYTFELAETVIAKRYDSCLTGFPLNTLADHKDAIWKQIKDVEGKLIVKEYPTKTASTNTLRAHLTKLIQSGTKPDMIIVDYADLMRTTSQRKEKREELESIYEELRAIMQEHNVVGWTASQTNRTGLESEIITMQSISEAFNKCFVADFIFSVSRTTEDKQTNGGRIYIAKNRNGPDGLVYSIFMDTSNVDIKVIDQYSRGENMTPSLSHEERQNLMFSKYKKFIGKGATT